MEKFKPMSLHTAAGSWGSVQMCRDFLESGVDVNTTTSYGTTPLHFASAFGNELIVRFLLENGADVDAINKDGCTPVRCAANGTIRAILETSREK